MWLLGDLGFDEVAVRERFDPFLGTSKEKVARKYHVAGVNVHAAKRHPPPAGSDHAA